MPHAATVRRKDRCRPRSRGPAPCRDRQEPGCACVGERRTERRHPAPAGCHVVAQRQLESNEVLEYRRHARPPAVEVDVAKVDAVNLDSAGLRVIEPAEQLRQRRLAGAVLADDGQRRPGGDRQIKALKHRLAVAG